MIKLNALVTLCLYITSLVSCSQDNCSVIRYTGMFSSKDHVKDHALLGHSYKNVSTKSTHQCFSVCVQDCRCVSYQLSGTRCELVDENRHTAPDSFKPVSGYIYFELKQDFKNKVITQQSNIATRLFNLM